MSLGSRRAPKPQEHFHVCQDGVTGATRTFTSEETKAWTDGQKAAACIKHWAVWGSVPERGGAREVSWGFPSFLPGVSGMWCRDGEDRWHVAAPRIEMTSRQNWGATGWSLDWRGELLRGRRGPAGLVTASAWLAQAAV